MTIAEKSTTKESTKTHEPPQKENATWSYDVILFDLERCLRASCRLMHALGPGWSSSLGSVLVLPGSVFILLNIVVKFSEP